MNIPTQNAKSFPLHVFALSALFLALSSNAFGEENNALEEIDVSTAANATATENTKSYTTSAMKTTTGLELSPKETPQSVSVITKSQLKHQGITSMDDAMRTTTGVTVLRDGPRYRYLSRGFYMDQIQEDGISSTVPGSAMNTYLDAQSSTDLAVYDHIEVVRGATGLTQANGQPGGTINAVFKRPSVNNQTQGSFLFDRFGKARTELDISRNLTEDNSVRGRFISALEHNPTFQDTQSNLALIYGVIDANLGDSTKLTVGSFYQRKIGTPDATGVVMGKEGEDLGFKYDDKLYPAWNREAFYKTQVFAELEHFITDDWKFNLKTAYIDNRSNSKFGTLAGSRQVTDTNEQARIGILSKYQNKSDEIAVKLNLTGKYQLLERDHDLFLTYSYSREKGKGHNIDAKFDSSQVFNVHSFRSSDLPEPDWRAMNWDGVSNNRVVTHSVYAGTRFNALDSLHILAAGNYSWFHSDYIEDAWNYRRNRAYNETTITSQKHFTPYLGITWDLGEHNSLYASYTSIFKPSYGRKDKAGKQVKPKTGHNYELGWKSAWYDGALNMSLALFQLEEKNRPVTITKAMDPSAERNYTATIGKVRSRGWEAEISGKLTDNWEVFFGYTYNFVKFVNDETATNVSGLNFAPFMPKHIVRLQTSYRLPFDEGKWQIGGGVAAQSKVESKGSKLRQGGYAVWNANIGYQMTKNIDLALIVNNLTNKRYYQNKESRSYVAGNYIAEPRNVMFQLNWQF